MVSKPYSEGQNIGDDMVPRYVVVPAIPTETGSVRIGARFYSSMAPSRFSIFDNKEKRRLPRSFPTRAGAEAECEAKNSEQLFSPNVLSATTRDAYAGAMAEHLAVGVHGCI